MPKRELNIFNVSFIDLLSGALAAVVILLLIIPKSSYENQEIQEIIAELELDVSRITELVNNELMNISAEVYQELLGLVEEMESTIEGLKSTILTQNQYIAELENNVEIMTAENERLQQALDAMNNRYNELEAAHSELQADLNSDNIQAGSKSLKFLFGTNADFAILYRWSEDLDFDIYLKENITGEVCYFRNTPTSFARLLEDIQKSTGEEGSEVIYMGLNELKTGNYTLMVKVYTEGGRSTPKGQIFLYPNSSRERKIDLPRQSYSYSVNPINVCDFQITSSDIRIVRMY